jgi:hypothetical protein
LQNAFSNEIRVTVRADASCTARHRGLHERYRRAHGFPRSLREKEFGTPVAARSVRRPTMDLFYLLLALVFFALSLALVELFDRL